LIPHLDGTRKPLTHGRVEPANLAPLCLQSGSGNLALEEIRQATRLGSITELALVLGLGEDLERDLERYLDRHFTLSPRILWDDSAQLHISLPEFRQYVDDPTAFRAH
jgi:hypothetical protein